jgi:transposase
MNEAWVGVDAGKEFHWAHVLDASGRELLSRRVENDEADIARLIDEALSLAEGIVWAVDQPGGSAALLLALLWERNQRVFYVSGLSVDRARDTYRGESKTDARDAHVIADQARMRPDLGELEAGELEIAELQLLLARRRDLKERIEGIDEEIEQRFFARPEARILTSLPGMGRPSGPSFW